MLEHNITELVIWEEGWRYLTLLCLFYVIYVYYPIRNEYIFHAWFSNEEKKSQIMPNKFLLENTNNFVQKLTAEKYA